MIKINLLNILKNPALYLPFFIGSVCFFILTQGKILDVTYIDWLLSGDPATYWFGWQFFRGTPFWQWPLGANYPYGMELSSSIIYSDSNTFLSLFFKIFSDYLPRNFQFFGIWIFILMFLQSFFSWKLLSRFINNNYYVFIGSIFFTLAPIFVNKLEGHFSSVASHWIILAGFCLYFSHQFNYRGWLALIIAISFGHFYFLLMGFGILAADLTQRYKLKQIKPLMAFVLLSSCIFIALYIMWITGAFMINNRFNFNAYGYYRMNLIAPFTPSSWSLFLPSYEFIDGEYEGFNYLGTGIFFMVMVAIASAFYSYWLRGKALPSSPILSKSPRFILWPLMIYGVCMFIYATTHKVAWGSIELWHIPLPQPIKNIGNAFRASGRFFAPVYYLIYLGLMLWIWRRFSNKVALILIGMALIIQLTDSSGALAAMNRRFTESQPYASPFKSPAWDELANRYRNLRMVKPIIPVGTDPFWLPFSEFALRHNMNTNMPYFARFGNAQFQAAIKKVVSDVQNSSFDDDCLYIITDPSAWEFINKRVVKDKDDRLSEHLIGTLDGYNFLAPKAKSCLPCIEKMGDDWHPLTAP